MCANTLRHPCSQESESQSPQWEGRVNGERGAGPEIWGDGVDQLLETWKGQQPRDSRKSEI